jgi:hypothetical protein
MQYRSQQDDKSSVYTKRGEFLNRLSASPEGWYFTKLSVPALNPADATLRKLTPYTQK